MDLSSRLSDYFRPSYLKAQASRGSAICAAILKYKLSEFTLQVIELGPSPTPPPRGAGGPPSGGSAPGGGRESISVNYDFIQLEQYYLDRYSLVYNIRRIALGPAPTANLDYNKGDTNSQFGKAGAKGAA
jgi:hypothetical protein